jgi:2-haloacid dehalogenase
MPGTANDILKREIQILTFDQYGTIVDMQTDLTEAVTPFLRDKGWDGAPHRFVTWWRRTHFENSMIDSLCDRGHTPYREIGHRAVSYVMDRLNITYSQDEVRWLISLIETLRPFDDVVEALERLGERYTLVILSNGDRDMLENAKPYLGYTFDHTISVEDAGYFKPHIETYRTTARLLDADRSTIMHVANHAFDCIGAKAYGMRTAFVDRRGRPYGETPHQPDLVVRSFTELADSLLE